MIQHHSIRTKRNIGYDLARGLAVFGMFLMNFKIVMQNPQEKIEGFWPTLLLTFEGRFGVLFIILAGIGMSLMTKNARETNDRHQLKTNQKTLLLRSIFLFVSGILYFPIWEADILHFYGIYIGMAVFIITWSKKQLISLLSFCTLVFVILFIFFDWENGWEWNTLSYINFWTAKGFVKNSFFNGFHPVFPWFSFFIFGMLIGRKDLTDKVYRKKCLLVAGGLVIFCESISNGLLLFFNTSDWGFFFSTLSFPPLPLFIISAGGCSLILIIICIIISENISQIWLNPFIYTGQMVLTHYVAHVVIAMVFLESIGKLYNQPLSFCVLFSIGYFTLSVMFSVVWRQKFEKGPLEIVMRKVSG